MARFPIRTWYFVVVVVRKGDRFCLVNESKHDGWYLPAGRVELGEGFAEAARRETLEEAGIPIRLDGILRIEHTPKKPDRARMRIIFLASPSDDTQLKSEPDDDTLEARWVSIEELTQLPMRGWDAKEILLAVNEGKLVAAPMSLMASEGVPYR